MAEARAYKKLKRMFPDAHWQRLESWTGTGIFDSNVCRLGYEYWIEFKEVTPPKNLTDNWVVKPKVRPAQIAWQAMREAAGGNTLIAIMVGRGLYVIPGNCIQELSKGMTFGKLKYLSLKLETLL